MKVVPVVVAVLVVASLFGTLVWATDSEDEKLDVLIVGGQSNTYATSQIDAGTATPVPVSGTGYYFGTESAPTYASSISLADCEMRDLNKGGSAAIGGVYPAFAAKYVEETGRKIYLIDTGLSGQTVYTFLPGSVNWQYVADVIAAGIAAIPSDYDVNVLGYLWIQGEGDSSTVTTTYETRMIQLHEAYNDGRLVVNLPTCFIVKVRDTIESGTVCNAAPAQTYLAEHVDGFVMATTLADTFTVDNGMVGSDDLHYTQVGCNALGASAAETVSDYAPTTADYSLLLTAIPIIVLIGAVIVIGRWVLTRD